MERTTLLCSDVQHARNVSVKPEELHFLDCILRKKKYCRHCEFTQIQIDELWTFVKKKDKNTELPVFTSDDWDPYKKALLEVYSVQEQPEYKGRGRPQKPIKTPLSDLKYAQIIKYKKKDKVETIEKKVVFGDKEKVLNKLEADGNTINTSYVERNNLTVKMV
jgi:hypothetical protein